MTTTSKVDVGRDYSLSHGFPIDAHHLSTGFHIFPQELRRQLCGVFNVRVYIRSNLKIVWIRRKIHQMKCAHLSR